LRQTNNDNLDPFEISLEALPSGSSGIDNTDILSVRERLIDTTGIMMARQLLHVFCAQSVCLSTSNLGDLTYYQFCRCYLFVVLLPITEFG